MVRPSSEHSLMLISVRAHGRLQMLLLMMLVFVFDFVCGSPYYEECAADSTDVGTGPSLLQARSKHQPTSELQERGRQMPLQANAPVAVGIARGTLPPHLYELGMQLFQEERVLDAVVASTTVISRAYAGVNMTIRTVQGDEVDIEDVYGLHSLHTVVANVTSSTGMLNMLDIGGNYGRISIAAFKKSPLLMRIIVVEPVVQTYFLLRWNLWLNAVPELLQGELQASPTKPGVLALNNGISDVHGKITDFCYTPSVSMAARICNCSNGFTHLPDEQCQHMVGLTFDGLVQVFSREPIAFLKMDCEGCELDVLPWLAAIRIGRFAGELHAVPNELEDFVCKFEAGQWLVHVCFTPNVTSGKQSTSAFPVSVSERCREGPGRYSCSRISYSELRARQPPPSEWYAKA